MGIIITFTEPFEMDNGLTITNAYASFKLSSPKIHKLTEVDLEGGGYRIDGELAYWVNRTAADSGKQPFHTMPYGFDVSELPADNLYQFLYSKIKGVETNVTITDDI